MTHPIPIPRKVDQIVADAAAFNLQAGVTGMLLFDGTRLLQYIEGSEDELGIALLRVYGATSYENVIELNRRIVGRRQFPFLSMHWIGVDQMALGKVAISDWTGFARAGGLQDRTGPLGSPLFGADLRAAQLLSPGRTLAHSHTRTLAQR
ncbi:TPA: BLUF domain-containing protein [Stenotrophomonas maltophilia]|nr:BLUF domain-containing protein [Stenotrophomonas maltophilia]